jgi:hypothetical protein
MNDHTTVSTFQLFQMFPDQESARAAHGHAERGVNDARYKICQSLGWARKRDTKQ